MRDLRNTARPYLRIRPDPLKSATPIPRYRHNEIPHPPTQSKRTQRTAEARTEELERVLEKVNHGEFPVPAPGSSVLAVYPHEVQVQGSSGLIVRFADGAAARVDWDSQMLSREEMMR